MALYDKIGERYDSTRKADPYITGRLLFHLKPLPNEKYLDLACGSGNYAVALKESGLNMYGIDISERMLRQAQQKGLSIPWFLGDAEALPFSDNSFTGATCILGIHHFKNLAKAFKELFRILTWRLVIFTATAEQMENYWLNEYFPEAMRKSIEQMPSKKIIEDSLLCAGFNDILWEPYEIQGDLQDFFLYIGKHHPEMYLDPQVRLGSSTFSSLADLDEVKEGCARLKADISSGRIYQIIKSYDSHEGDYMFGVARIPKA